jgi:glycosyltransferase involved in cell wall biosynthesis
MEPIKTNFTVSVVIPAYNCGSYIGRTIDSVLTQSRLPDEVIVVDDGSTDNTAAVSTSYGSRVNYIYQPNAGASAARNAGIKAANSEWIAFLDGDDEWLVDNLKMQLELLGRNEGLVWSAANYIRCNSGQQTIDLRGEKEIKVKNLIGDKEYFDSYFEAYMSSARWCSDTMIIKRCVLQEAGLFLAGQKRMNDIDMWLRIAYKYPQIGYVFEPLAIYHTDVPGSIVKEHKEPENIHFFIERHLAAAAEHNLLDEFRPYAASLLGYWIGAMLQEKKGAAVRKLLKEYGYLYSKYFIATAFIKSLFPRTGLCYDRIKGRGLKILRRFCKFVTNFILYIFLRSNTCYRLFLRKKYQVNTPDSIPNIQWENKVLEKREEWIQASDQVKKLKLPLFSDKQKNWDSLAALSAILKRTDINSHVLDAGSELYSMILPWLFLYGYKKLTGINLVFNYPIKRGTIRYRYGDITKTNFTDNSFDAISCLSVVEHGVNLHAYFKEMSRILKPDGILVTSTDYFDVPIDTENLNAYGKPVHIFSKDEIIAAIEIAKQYNLELTGPVDLNCDEKTVRWTRYNLDYTFLVLTMQKKC